MCLHLYGFETWSVTILAVVGTHSKRNKGWRCLRKGLNGGKATGEWRGLRNELIHDFDSSSNITRENEIKEMDRACSTYEVNMRFM